MSRRPSNTALNRWYRAQPRGNYTCRECGHVGPDWQVQPQHPYWGGGARCTDCLNRAIYAARAARRAQLAAEPRCQVPGCRRRGSYKVGGGGLLMCGAHLKRAQAGAARAAGGLFWVAWDADNAALLAWAQGGPS